MRGQDPLCTNLEPCRNRICSSQLLLPQDEEHDSLTNANASRRDAAGPDTTTQSMYKPFTTVSEKLTLAQTKCRLAT